MGIRNKHLKQFIPVIFIACLAGIGLMPWQSSLPFPAQASEIPGISSKAAPDSEPSARTAPAQSWNKQMGKVALQGNLAQGSGSGGVTVSDGAEDWLLEMGAQAGLLNEDFSFGLDLAGGWAGPSGFGLWLALVGEFSPDFVDHWQATLNLGYRFNERFKLMSTLDYLNKHLEIERWERGEAHNQYGAGLALDYLILPDLDLSVFYQHYQTDGEEYGQVGDYEYIDADNIQHYGIIHAGVRGGDYDEAGLGADYRHPGGHFVAGLTLSQVWRSYEEMLGYAAKDEQNAAGRVHFGWLDILDSGVNLRAGIAQEFSSVNRLNWNLGLNRRVGPVLLGLTYSEFSNDRSTTDRRIYASLSLPLGAVGSAVQAAARAVKEAGRPSRKAAFRGAWLKEPVSGMGDPALKVAQELERRVDETIVDLDELAEGVTVSKNLMTISGLPALASLDTTNSRPSSAFEAFSIGDGGTSVQVDLTKLPAPEYIQAIFLQEDGLYTIIALQTEQGSIKVDKEGQVSNVSKPLMEVIKNTSTNLKRDTSKFKGVIHGPSTMYVSDIKSYIAQQYDEDLTPWDVTVYYEVSGAGEVDYVAQGGILKIKGTKPGTITITAYVFGEEPETKSYYHVVTKTVTVKALPGSDDGDGDDENGGGGDDDDDDGGGGDTGGSCGSFRKEGDWTLNDTGGGGFFLNIVIDENGNVVSVTNPAGSSTEITSDTGGCFEGKYNGNITCIIGGNTYSYDINLDISGNNIQAGSQVTEFVNFVPGTIYNVTGSRVGPP